MNERHLTMHESKFFCRFIMSLSRKSEAFIRFETRKTSKASIISQISNFLNDNSRISENRSTNIFSIIPAAFAIHSRLFFFFFFATLNTRRYFCPPSLAFNFCCDRTRKYFSSFFFLSFFYQELKLWASGARIFVALQRNLHKMFTVLPRSTEIKIKTFFLLHLKRTIRHVLRQRPDLFPFKAAPKPFQGYRQKRWHLELTRN